MGSPRNASAGFAGSAAASPPVAGQDSEAPERVPGNVSILGPLKQIWPPEDGKKKTGRGSALASRPGADQPGGTMVQWDTVVTEPKTYDGTFAKCQGCAITWPTAALDLGLCSDCSQSGQKSP